MTDREILELAAKAAGFKLNVSQSCGAGLLLDCQTFWSPLTDDGDALRLAVRLGFLFSYMGDRFELFQRYYLEGLDADLPPTEATRRAVVRAAAEVGRGMQ